MVINKATLDAKDAFHATQIAAWQRGPPNINLLDGITLYNTPTLRALDAMSDITTNGLSIFLSQQRLQRMIHKIN